MRIAGTPLHHMLHWHRDIAGIRGPNDLSWVSKSCYTSKGVPPASSA